MRFRHASLPSGGELLSNTSIIYRIVRDNLGKLRVRPDSELGVEFLLFVKGNAVR